MPWTGGISLSPAFVVMFVMQHHQLSWEDALHMVQNRRYCISPNCGFLTQIKARALSRFTITILISDYRNTKPYIRLTAPSRHTQTHIVSLLDGKERTTKTTTTGTMTNIPMLSLIWLSFRDEDRKRVSYVPIVQNLDPDAMEIWIFRFKAIDSNPQNWILAPSCNLLQYGADNKLCVCTVAPAIIVTTLPTYIM